MPHNGALVYVVEAIPSPAQEALTRYDLAGQHSRTTERRRAISDFEPGAGAAHRLTGDK